MTRLVMETEVNGLVVRVRVILEVMRLVMNTMRKVVTRSPFVCQSMFLPVQKWLGSEVGQNRA